MKSEPIEIFPFAYYTDGGVDTNSNYYFLQNLWKKTGICYCTTAHANVHVQSILSKTIDVPPADNNPMKFLESSKNKLKIRIPYEKYVTIDSDMFHILKTFQIHLKSGGYNAYAQSFAVFYSECEIENDKFNSMTKRFTKALKYPDLNQLRLKIHHKDENKKSGVKVVEFDVSKTKNVER
jgi:hypothetical protein